MDSIPVLLLHGALGARSQLQHIHDTLQKRGREVYSMNFSGHNGERFSTDGFGIEIFAEEVRKFLEQYGISKVDIFGYSMGGYVALWMAHVYPEKVNRVICLGTKFDWDIASAEKECRKMDPDRIAEKVPAFARVLESRHRPNDWKVLMHKTRTMMLDLGNRPLLTESILAGINIPVDVYLGDQDDMADLQYSKKVASILPRGRFILLEATPHPLEKTNFIPFINDDPTHHD